MNDSKLIELARIVERLAMCKRCYGTGTVSTRDGPDECPECHGSGSQELGIKDMTRLRTLAGEKP